MRLPLWQYYYVNPAYNRVSRVGIQSQEVRQNGKSSSNKVNTRVNTMSTKQLGCRSYRRLWCVPRE